MDERKNLAQARALIPLLRSISNEIRDRRNTLARLEALRDDLANRASERTNEGFIIAIQDLDTTIAAQKRGIEVALKEFRQLGLKVPSERPLVVHIPGRTSRGDVMFSWEEGVDGFEKEPTDPVESPETS